MTSVLALLAAVNPFAVAVALWPREARRPMVAGAVIALAVAVLVAATSDAIVDGLDVTPGTLRVAAAVVLGLVGARWLLLGAPDVAGDGPADGWGRIAVPVLFPVVLTPQLVIVSLSVGVDDGVALVAASAAAGLALAVAAAVLPKRQRAGWTAGVRLVGALAITMALILAVDGVKTV